MSVASVRGRVVDVEIVKLAGRAIAAELFRLGLPVRLAAAAAGLPAWRYARRRISFSMQSAPSDFTEPRTNSRASYRLSPSASPASPSTTRLPDCAMKPDMWPMLPCTTMSMPFIEMPQRLEALPLMTSKPAAPGRAGILAGIAVDDDRARHHVLGHARPGRALDADRRLLVHARAVIAGRPAHRDVHRRIHPGGNRMGALGVDDLPGGHVGLALQGVQRGVQRAQALLRPDRNSAFSQRSQK